MNTNILIFTGASGPGISIAAVATALYEAQSGRKTLLLSFGPSHSAGALLNAQLNGKPQQVAPDLDAIELDTLGDVSTTWQELRAGFGSQFGGVAGDELPVLPGADLLLGLQRLSELAPTYACVVVDAGAQDMFLRTLSLPDSLRWIVRLLLGLDRGPGKSSASIGRALLPVSFIPLETRDGIQNFRLEAEQTREQLAARTAVRYVLRPDQAGFAEARLAVPALQLHGLPVTTLVAGPLLPSDSADERIAQRAAQERRVLEEARQVWSSRPLLTFDSHTADNFETLSAIGDTIAHAPASAMGNPVALQHNGEAAVALDLPGMPKGVLQLAINGDELIVRIGPYRRHLLLPENLRGITAIRATREGDLLVVRRRV
jgi:anion-transporting  ArsA/GET3 family ATPase